MWDLTECYIKMGENCEIEVGDYVKILRKAQDYELGWDEIWLSDMSDMIGGTYRVEEVHDGSFLLRHGNTRKFYFPWFVVSLVEERTIDYRNNFNDMLQLHKKIWQWLSENPTKSKENWPGWEKYDIDPNDVENQCFLCEYCKLHCSDCPGNWGYYADVHGDDSEDNAPCELGEFGFFEKFGDFSDEILSRMCKKIAEICD